ncbi:MAG: OmpA family protein [Deltaproteobacteria bacterium]|nr:OmpA family protein [Deltaproteobacteria bacterium]
MSIFFSLLSVTAFARYPNNSIVYVRPSIDAGRYIVTEQSQGLYQWGYNIGMNLNYAFEPAELVPATGGGRVAGVVDDLLVADFTASLGLLDWLNVGIDVPLVAYETFFNFINPDASQCVVTAACPKQTKTKLGDILFAAKVRLIDSDRSMFGLSLQPFISFPTGSGYYLTGYGQFSGGAKAIFDLNIKDRVYLALNVGYQVLKERRYAPDTANAKINDLILVSGAANVPIGRNFAAIAEVYGQTLAESPFKHQIQSPFEAMAGLRYSPGNIKRWMFTLAGGTGLDKGFGAPAWRAWGQVTYKKTKVVELPGEGAPVSIEAPFEEKIIITQKIHFAFDKWEIRPVSYPILNDVVEVLHQYPNIRKMRIEGHTDNIGSDAYNEKLSQKRAESVRQYLIAKGIAPERLEAAGYGESTPVATNDTELGRAKNRRTEFTIVEE